MKSIDSLEDKRRELESTCDERLKVLEMFERKGRAEMASWNVFYPTKEQFTKLIQKAVPPYDITKIFDIINKCLPYFPVEDTAKDLDTYGGLKAACYKLTGELQKLKNEYAILEFKRKTVLAE